MEAWPSAVPSSPGIASGPRAPASAMAKLQGLQADCVFRGVEHVVRLTVEGNLLEVEVEDRLTTDQWRGEFDAAFIEDLTHKTGNFKQFGIFCSMLESALAQSSESVTLDLLTYADLESLRSRKMGVGFRHLSAPKSSPLNAKRYLILIYSVEFDRIHYPLPLPYVGKPDPIVLQKVIRELKEELATLKGKPGRVSQDMEIRQLREELQRALEEKQEARLALRGLEEERKLASKSAALKEVQVLKKLVQSLEEELAKERAKHQRLASKRLQENRQLAGELAELKATERTLRIRLKNLTSELALFKKGCFTPVGTSPQNHSAASHELPHPTLARTGPRKRDSHRPTSGERSNSRERSGAWGPSRPRSTSREGCSGSQGRLPRQSPSPTGARAPRFDPTAFVKAKERKQKEAEQRNKRGLRRGVGDTLPSSWQHRAQSRGPSAFGKAQGRSSSVESFRSRRSSASSGSEMDDFSEPGASRGRRRGARGRKPLSSSSWNGPTLVPRANGGRRKHLASTPTAGKRVDKENLYDEPSADLSEIDARLQALQEYMNKLETRT
ncbi:centrosomal protein CCDC61 isoform X2 [Varanus komodoensis]|uniref:centrosomal protein CCDC61 isoform X2 n=1 Tax=Varanus komodoensis TaxID=61221 RepID=UPI001CF77E00|nr:centrosomal protein CCDC61 isoform X2 [Varanus komodoensis]